MNNTIGEWVNGFYELNPDADRHEIETKIKKVSTLSLKTELQAMDYRDMDFYMNLSDEHKKEISLWLLMRYMSSSKSAAIDHLLVVNDVVNMNFSVISKHPELQWKLLALCGTKKSQFHEWIPPGKKSKKNKIEEALIKFFPLMKDDDLEMLQQINTKEDFEQFFRENAFDDKAIKEIFKGDTKGK